MHIYNAWLPPPVAERAALEGEAFAQCVRQLQQDWRPEQPSSRSATIKWICVINNFLKAKSNLATMDIELLVKTVLDLIFCSDDNFYIQARWSSMLARILKKYGKKIKLTIRWQPFYDLLRKAYFKRRQGFEGLALKQFRVDCFISLIRSSRRFFLPGSAAEIWSEFRSALDDLSHNSSLMAAGYISLFLPTNSERHCEFYTSEWLEDCLQLWDGVPNCKYWDLQWGSLLGRCMKHCASMLFLDMEPFLPRLFSHFLCSFEVPVGKGSVPYPYQREIPREAMLVFAPGWSQSVAKDIAKAIVFVLKPGSSAQKYFETMINLLEQYYHPSNGGPWTSTLESFLRNLVLFFLRRLAQEQRKRVKVQGTAELDHFLGIAERKAFIKTLMRLIERGQYSKNAALCRTAAMASARLSFIEPSLVLPLVISRFYTALDSITATHQLEAAVTTVALAVRCLLLASFKELPMESQVKTDELYNYDSYGEEFLTNCKDVLVFTMFSTLQGMDANDPPKTLATLQLFCSIISNLGKLGDKDDGATVVLSIDWSQWLDDFLARLFALLVHLEPSSQPVETGVNNDFYLYSKTFLVQGESFFLYLLELLFGRLTRPLFQQALKKVGSFICGNVLPGAVAEVGLLCSALVYASSQEAVTQLIVPLINSVLSSLQDALSTGFSGSGGLSMSTKSKFHLSPALETSVVYQLNVLSIGLMYVGSSIILYKDPLIKAIAAAFDAPSSKVNEAGARVLSSLLGSMVFYFPLDQYKLHTSYPGFDGVEDWMSTKGDYIVDEGTGPVWHTPNQDEIAYANELLELHLLGALRDLRRFCQDSWPLEFSGREKEQLRVVLLRIAASLRGVRSCLPDFEDSELATSGNGMPVWSSYIAGAVGVSVGSAELRKHAAETLHIASEYLLEKWADDSALLLLLGLNMNLIGNYGSVEYGEWSNGKQAWQADSEILVEPPINFITNHHSFGKRRPKWMIIEMVYLHNSWRASQFRYNWYRLEAEDSIVPYHITLLTGDLLKLSLHNYAAVRSFAGASIKKIFKRFPSSIKNFMGSLLNCLHDPGAPQHSALGACAVLTSRPVLQYLAKDLNALASFLLSMLNSSHHESVKAQTAINEMFILFNVQYGGFPIDYTFKKDYANVKSYMDLVSQIKDFCANSPNVHWRYNLMAQGMLLLLLVTPSSKASCCSLDEALQVRESIAGNFLQNLKSDLPPLRPLSVVALLLLLQASPYKIRDSNQEGLKLDMLQKKQALSLENSLIPILQEQEFGSMVLHGISLDHNYIEEQTRSGQGRAIPQRVSDVGLTAWFPSFWHDWPRTRTWDPVMKGDAFSPKFAKLFKRLVQECGPEAFNSFQSPLEEAAFSSGERAKHCTAVEVMAGFLHSDVDCVLKAWDGWMRPLLQRAIIQSSMESTSELAASIRFAVTGKGETGRIPPLMRPLVLDCLAEKVPPSASSGMVARRFTLLAAAIAELLPASRLKSEISFQVSLLKEVLSCMSHAAPQVRESVGTILCIIASNLHQSFSLMHLRKDSVNVDIDELHAGLEWKAVLMNNINDALIKIRNIDGIDSDDSGQSMMTRSNTSDLGNHEVQDTVKWMETVFYFIIAAMKSGRSMLLMEIIVKLLQPVLSLQDISHKDLSSLARSAFHLLKWQSFLDQYLSKAVAGLLYAMNNSNWRTRIAALSFLQPFIYRHSFTLTSSDLVSLWDQVEKLLSDTQVEVREMASFTLAGMMKVSDIKLTENFRGRVLGSAASFLDLSRRKNRRKVSTQENVSPSAIHGTVLGLAACTLSVPYDVPRWLPNIITTLACFKYALPPIRTTVTKTVAEFRRTHADMWTLQKNSFTEEQLEVAFKNQN